MKQDRSRKLRRSLALLSGWRRRERAMRAIAHVTLISFVVLPLAAPLGADTVDTRAFGDVRFESGTGQFTIDTQIYTQFDQSVRAGVLDFSIDIQQPGDHTLEFIQSANESMLLRMPGVMPANFFGSVIAPGELVIANPAGVFFQDGSFVNVGNLIAVGAEVESKDYLDRSLLDLDLTGPVMNWGRVEANDVLMAGSRVANFGNIVVADGSLVMMAGDRIRLRRHGSPIVVSSPTPLRPGRDLVFGDEPLIENTGVLSAGTGEVRLAAGDLLSFAIRNSGQIEAQEITLDGGKNGLVENSGRLDASNHDEAGIGGRIDVLGGYVSIIDEAVLDASGDAGGGSIHVGGARSGGDELRSAKRTYVGENTTLRADALGDGDGGEIIVWADEVAHVYGEISARGGVDGGNGGFAETSGKLLLDLGNLAPDLRARSNDANDENGVWLIDPINIEIVAACSAGSECIDDPLLEGPDWQADLVYRAFLQPEVENTQILNSIIATALSRGTSVEITTEAAKGVRDPDQAGNITVFDSIVVPDLGGSDQRNATLTLLAANHITIEESIINESSNLNLNVVLRANDTFTGISGVLSFGQPESRPQKGETDPRFVGDVIVKGDIITGGGDVFLNGVNIELGQLGDSIDIDTGGGEFDAWAGARVEVNTEARLAESAGGDFSLYGNITTARDASSEDRGGNVSINAISNIRPITRDKKSESALFGGDILVDGDIQTDGGNIAAESLSDVAWVGGEIKVSGRLSSTHTSPTSDEERGGNVSLIAPFTTSAAINEENIIREGGVRLARTSAVETGGGQFIVNSASIFVNGDVDTTFDKGTATTADDEIGGRITLTAQASTLAGFQGRVVIQDLRSDTSEAQLRTGGGSFTSSGSGGGDFVLIDSSIDTRASDSAQYDEGANQSSVNILFSDAVQILSRNRDVDLQADDSIFVQSATRVIFDGTGSGSERNVTLSADSILLQSGDGPDGGGSNFSVEGLQGVKVTGRGGEAGSDDLEGFRITQDATIDTDDFGGNALFGGPIAQDVIYTLESVEGDVIVSDKAAVFGEAGDGVDPELALVAASGIEFDEALDPNSVGLLTLGVTQDLATNPQFKITDELASEISGAASELVIFDIADLEIQGDLMASDRLELRGGANGSGDLLFSSNVLLTSDDIRLRAGGGGTSGSQVLAGDDQVLQFAQANAANPWKFTLRQDGAIDLLNDADNQVVPVPGQFAGGIAGLDYTLRSDGGSIVLEKDGLVDSVNGTNLVGDTHLSLHASQGIFLGDELRDDVEDGITGQLGVRSLDIGGLAGFTYSKNLDALLDRQYTNWENSLTIRSGLQVGGDLGFEVELDENNDVIPFVIESDEIRLVAGGLSGSSSSIRCAPDCPVFVGAGGSAIDTFVFRQRGQISALILPEFAPALTPDTYVVQSDGGNIDIASFDSDRLPTAQSLLILSANGVNLTRTDGEDLDLNSDFDLVANDAQLEIRANSLGLRANDLTAEDDSATPAVLPGNRLFITGFDEDPDPSADVSNDVPLVPEEISTTQQAINERPRSISITQEDDIGLANLIDVSSQVSSQAGPDGELREMNYFVSSQGEITVTPDYVDGTFLGLDAVDDIHFETPTIAGYDVLGLSASTDFDWTVDEAGPNPLIIKARDSITMVAGTSNDGVLDFGSGVTFIANEIRLAAGSTNSVPSESDGALVDAHTNAPTFVFANRTEPRTGEIIDPSLQIIQDATFIGSNTAANASAEVPESRIPDPSQLQGVQLGRMTLESEIGDIRIDDVTDSFESIQGAPKNLELIVEQNDPDLGGSLILGSASATQDTDLTIFDEAFFSAAGKIELIAGPDQNVVAAKDTLSFFTPSILIQYNQNDLDEDVVSCTGDGCLPFGYQISGPRGGVDSVEYVLEANGGRVVLNDRVAKKAETANLVIKSDTGVVINAEQVADSGRWADIWLSSLIVGAGNDPVDIVFSNEAREDGSQPNAATSIYTLGDQTYYGNVTVDGGAFAATGEVILLAGDIANAADEVAELALNVKAQLRLEGDTDLAVGSGDGPEGLLSVRFDANSLAQPDLQFGVNTTTKVFEPGVSVQPQTIRANRIEIAAVEDLSKPLEHSIRTPEVSTIYKEQQSLTFQAHDLSFAEGERISVANTLTFEGLQPGTRANEISIGDANALDLVFRGTTIELVRRAAGHYLGSDGKRYSDGGVDYVANSMVFDGDIALAGHGERPSFALQAEWAIPEALNGFSVTTITADATPLTVERFESEASTSLLDLHPEGPSRDDISDVYVDPVPEPDPWLADSLLPTPETPLERLDIRTRPSTLNELVGRLDGAFVIDDVGTMVAHPLAEVVEVSEQRILVGDARAAAEMAETVFGPENSRTEDVRAILQAALDRYHKTSGARRVLGFEFRRYVLNRPSTEFDAYQVLEDLDTLFRHHRRLGLAPGEYRPIQLRWLAAIRPDGISVEELGEAVQPSRFIRGSDILDIFGE